LRLILFAGGARLVAPGGVEVLDGHLRDAFHDFIAQIVVFLALLPQARAVEENGFDRFQGLRGGKEVVGRKQPGPAQIIARPKCLGRQSALFPGFVMQRNFARQNKIEPVGRVAFPKDAISRLEFPFHGQGGQQLKLRLLQPLEEGLFGNQGAKRVGRRVPAAGDGG